MHLCVSSEPAQEAIAPCGGLKERVMGMQSPGAKLAARFEKMAADGLVDVKFFVRNIDEASPDSVCEEVLRLYEAVDRGEEFELDFGDSTRA